MPRRSSKCAHTERFQKLVLAIVLCCATAYSESAYADKVAFVPRFFDRSVQKLVLLAGFALAHKRIGNSATLQLIGVLIFYGAPNAQYIMRC